MIQVETITSIADNSGAIRAQCIKILKNKNIAQVGDEIVITIKKAKPNHKLRKGEIHKAVLVRAKKEWGRLDGSTLKFNKNDIILINKEKQPLGNRVFGPVTYELRDKKLLKLITLAPLIL